VTVINSESLRSVTVRQCEPGLCANINVSRAVSRPVIGVSRAVSRPVTSMNQTGSHLERFDIRTENFEKPVLVLILKFIQLRSGPDFASDSGSDFAFDSRVVLILRLTQVLVLILTATRVVGPTSH